MAKTKVKRLIKRILSFTPKWFFNFLIRLTKNKAFDSKPNPLILDCYSEDNGKTCIRKQKPLIKDEYDLHIIVPCFNIAKYGRRCIESIVNQKTKYSYFLVLVNDGSTDETLAILNEYKNSNIRIIDKENGGSSSARNAGLDEIRSKYVMFVDSDDCLIDEYAIEKSLDLINSLMTNNKIIIEYSYKNSANSHSIKQPKHIKLKAIDSLELTGFPWGKIYSSSLFENVEFPESYWFEDTVLHSIVYQMADKCFKSNLLIYYYQTNESGMTSLSKMSPKTLDTFYITKSLLSDYTKLKLNESQKFFVRFYMQTICNVNRLLNYPEEIRLEVFYETRRLLEEYKIPLIKQFKTLYLSLKNKKFLQYENFCKYYSAIYLNLD